MVVKAAFPEDQQDGKQLNSKEFLATAFHARVFTILNSAEFCH